MKICIFCGSQPGLDPAYAEAARTVARLMAARGHGLVYGGGRTGLMGIVADAVLEAGGEVTGVMPRHLIEREIQHTGLTRLHMVETMHERKLMMAELADAFLALSGGPGTLEEIVEQWTWAVLGIHRKPCGFLNVKGFYDHLIRFADHMTEEGFLQPAHRNVIIFSDSPVALLDGFQSYKPPVPRWQL